MSGRWAEQPSVSGDAHGVSDAHGVGATARTGLGDRWRQLIIQRSDRQVERSGDVSGRRVGACCGEGHHLRFGHPPAGLGGSAEPVPRRPFRCRGGPPGEGCDGKRRARRPRRPRSMPGPRLRRQRRGRATSPAFGASSHVPPPRGRGRLRFALVPGALFETSSSARGRRDRHRKAGATRDGAPWYVASRGSHTRAVSRRNLQMAPEEKIASHTTRFAAQAQAKLPPTSG